MLLRGAPKLFLLLFLSRPVFATRGFHVSGLAVGPFFAQGEFGDIGYIHVDGQSRGLFSAFLVSSPPLDCLISGISVEIAEAGADCQPRRLRSPGTPG